MAETIHNTSINSDFSREELLEIIESMHDTFFRVDNDGYLISLSRSVSDLLGYSLDEMVGTNMADYYAEPDGREKFLSFFHESGGYVNAYEIAFRHKNGEIIWASTNAHFYRNADGEILGIEGSSRDVTSKIIQQQELVLLKNTLDKTLDCVFMFESDSLNFCYVNEGGINHLGYKKEEIVQMKPYDIKPMYDEETFRKLIQPLIDGQDSSMTFDTIHRHKNGKEIPVEVFLQYIKHENARPRFLAIVRDISERVETQEKLHYLAHHDHLTGLPNRLLFLDRLEHALLRRSDEYVAMLFIDLDRFKIINDTLGHASGDKILNMFSKRLLNCTRKSDTIARLSGDEFAVILEDVKSSDDVIPVVQHILEKLTVPFAIGRRELFVTASIGISMSPYGGCDTQTLLKNADIAMYRAKEKGRNTYQLYIPDMDSKSEEKLSLETAIRYAIERNEFSVVYQPQLNYVSGEIIGFEALLRWCHPEWKSIGPCDFIPVLEETGLIETVGEWVLKEACSQVKMWQEKYNKDFRISVNISARQFQGGELIYKVKDCLKKTKLAAHTLELEITESILLYKTDTVMSAMKELDSMGVRIALDDFGTGYSSLSYLKQFPINTIKIDKSFVQDITTDEDDAAIVCAIIAIAKSLKMDLVAEGVEQKEQLDFIIDKGCSVIQGFHFSKPVSADEMEVLLSDNN